MSSSQKMGCIEDESVDLVVTSPPYPMIEMWDNIMSLQNPLIKEALSDNPSDAFEMMHQELDKVWRECYRILKNGGMMCINIGDATRTITYECNYMYDKSVDDYDTIRSETLFYKLAK